MKAVMKLQIIMLFYIGILLNCAEKRLNPDKVIRESWKNGGHIDQATINTLLQQQKERENEHAVSFYRTTVENYIAAQERVPERIIRNADPDLAELAQKHNESLKQTERILAQMPQG